MNRKIIRRTVYTLILNLIGIACFSQKHSKDNNLNGIWYVTELINSAIYADEMDTSQVRSKLVITENFIDPSTTLSIIPDVNMVKSFQVISQKVISNQDFEQRYRIPYKDLGLSGDSLVEITTNLEGHPLSHFIMSELKDILLLGWDGRYFKLLKGVRYSANRSDALEAILKMHRLQREYHFNKDSIAFVNQLSDNFISVNRGQITRPSRKETLSRYHNYFSSVDFLEWDDVNEPIITFSEDGSMAFTVVDKIVAIAFTGDNGKIETSETHFAWTAIYRKYGNEWKIDCVTSTEKKSK